MAKLLTTSEAAFMLRLRPATVRDWARRGLICRQQDGRWDLRQLVQARDTPKPNLSRKRVLDRA